EIGVGEQSSALRQLRFKPYGWGANLGDFSRKAQGAAIARSIEFGGPRGHRVRRSRATQMMNACPECDGRLTPTIASASGVRSVVLLDEDARALNVLRGVDAQPLERSDDGVSLGLVFQVLHVGLALYQLHRFRRGQTTGRHAVGDAMRLRVLARIDPGRAGEAGCRGDGKYQRSKKYGLHGKSPS